jgi:hypothetical protein
MIVTSEKLERDINMTNKIDHELDDYDDEGNFQRQLEQPLPIFADLPEFAKLPEFARRMPASAVIQDFTTKQIKSALWREPGSVRRSRRCWRLGVSIFVKSSFGRND